MMASVAPRMNRVTAEKSIQSVGIEAPAFAKTFAPKEINANIAAAK